MIQELSAKHGGAPVSIDSLVTQLQMSRPDLFSFLVDLSLAGSIELNQNTVKPIRVNTQ